MRKSSKASIRIWQTSCYSCTKKEAAKADDDLDLFGDDNEEDAEAAKKIAAAAKEKAQAKPKKVVIA